MRNRKILIGLITYLILVVTVFQIPVYANSAQAYWYGVDAAGTIVIDQNSPIEVEHELLVFDIHEFPKSYYANSDEFLEYSGKVQAEYTFFNPSNYQVTMKLAFPFGNEPHYGQFHNSDTNKYGITVNEETIEPTLRFSFNNSWNSFDLEEDLPKLLDHYKEDEFYSPDLMVTKYIFEINGIDSEAYPAANVAFDYDGGDGKTKIWFLNQSGFDTLENNMGRISAWTNKTDKLEIFVLGEDFDEFPKWTCYEDGGVKDNEVIEGQVSLISKEIFSFEDIVFANWNEEYGVSKLDWYNAFIDYLDYYSNYSNYNLIDCSSSSETLLSCLMRWYVYELTIEPQTRVINKVSAPIYPAIDTSYEPSIYEYTYLLSPASTYSKFGDLDIEIHSPYYLITSDMEGFEKTEYGYKLCLEGLPESELMFTLSSEQTPRIKMKAFGYFIPIIVFIIFMVVLFVVRIIFLDKFKKYKEK